MSSKHIHSFHLKLNPRYSKQTRFCPCLITISWFHDVTWRSKSKYPRNNYLLDTRHLALPVSRLGKFSFPPRMLVPSNIFSLIQERSSCSWWLFFSFFFYPNYLICNIYSCSQSWIVAPKSALSKRYSIVVTSFMLMVTVNFLNDKSYNMKWRLCSVTQCLWFGYNKITMWQGLDHIAQFTPTLQ